MEKGMMVESNKGGLLRIHVGVSFGRKRYGGKRDWYPDGCNNDRESRI